MNKTPTVETFSSDYLVATGATLREYGGDSVVIGDQIASDIATLSGSSLMKLSDGHYWASSEWGVPPRVIGIPEDADHERDETVLVARRGAARKLGERVDG